MNNIYIGNRYVPVFANPVEWDNLREYEPLTIVTYQGTAYTSRQTVPVGTALSNTDYWVVTGNYNAQVEQYRQDTLQLAEDLSDFESETADNFTSVGNNITSLGNAITRLGNRTTAVENLLHRKYVFIGDSYAGVTQSWVDRACTVLGATLNTNAWKYAYGGVGFAATNDNKNFGTLLTDAHTALADIDDEITDVIVAGGCNDALSAHSTSDINSAKNDFFNNCRTYFPNARIFIACIGGFQDFTQRKELVRVKWIYNYPTDKHVIPITNAYVPMLMNAYFGDRVHPNTNGSLAIGGVIGTAVLSCSTVGVVNNNLISWQIDTWNTELSSHTGDVKIMQTSNGVQIINNALGLNFTDAKSIGFGNGVTLYVGRSNRGSACLTALMANSDLGDYVSTVPCVVHALVNNRFKHLNGQLAFVYDATSGGIDVYVKVQTGADATDGTVTSNSFRIEGINSLIQF